MIKDLELLKEYVHLQSEYIQLLNSCYKNAVSFEYVHHYREDSEDIKKAKEIGRRLDLLTEKIKNTIKEREG